VTLNTIPLHEALRSLDAAQRLINQIAEAEGENSKDALADLASHHATQARKSVVATLHEIEGTLFPSPTPPPVTPAQQQPASHTDRLTAALRELNWHIGTCDPCHSYAEGWGDKCPTRSDLEAQVDTLISAEQKETHGHTDQAA
jgi:hypothetical protein